MTLDEDPAPLFTTHRRAGIVFLAAALLLLFWGLGAREMMGSEQRWAEVTREMLLSGDYLHPTINGQPYFDKPLLSYWLIALAAFAGGGINEWTLRFPSATAALVGLWATVLLGRRLWSAKVGFTAGWMLLSTYGFLLWARRGESDMQNLVAVVLAVTWYWYRRGKPSFGSYLGFYLICFLGAQTKGLAAVAVPVLAVLPDLMRQGRWKQHLKASNFLALALGLGVYLLPFTWAALSRPEYHASGLGLALRENITRFFHPFDHVAPFYIYFFYVPEFFLPWTPLLIAAVAAMGGSVRKLEANTRWLLEAVIFIFLFFTLSGSRRAYYILPLLPFCALLTAVFIDTGDWRKWKQAGFGLQKTMLALALVVIFGTAAIGPLVRKYTGFALPHNLMLYTPVLGLMALAPWVLNRFQPGLPGKLLGTGEKTASLMAAFLVLSGGIFCWQLVSLNVYATKKSFATQLSILAQDLGPQNIAFYRRVSPRILFYAGLPVPTRVLKEIAGMRRFLQSGRSEKVLIAPLKYFDSLRQTLPAHIRIQSMVKEKVYTWEKRTGKKKFFAWRLAAVDALQAGRANRQLCRKIAPFRLRAALPADR